MSGLRAQEFDDLLFIDHPKVQVQGKMGIIFVILDGATNLLWAKAQSDERNETTLQALRDWMDQYQCRPRGILADIAFSHPTFERFYRFHGIRFYSTGPRTPWPNRAETAIRLSKRQYQFLTQFLQEAPTIPSPTLEHVVQKCVWARNNQLTVSGEGSSRACVWAQTSSSYGHRDTGSCSHVRRPTCTRPNEHADPVTRHQGSRKQSSSRTCDETSPET